MTYLTKYIAQTKGLPTEGLMLQVASNYLEAILLTEAQVAKRPEVTFVRAKAKEYKGESGMALEVLLKELEK